MRDLIEFAKIIKASGVTDKPLLYPHSNPGFSLLLDLTFPEKIPVRGLWSFGVFYNPLTDDIESIFDGGHPESFKAAYLESLAYGEELCTEPQENGQYFDSLRQPNLAGADLTWVDGKIPNEYELAGGGMIKRLAIPFSYSYITTGGNLPRILLPKNGNYEGALRLLDYLASREGAEGVFFGVPGSHWRPIDGESFEGLTSVPFRHTYDTNPLIRLSIAERPHLQDIREPLQYEYAPAKFVHSPEGFVPDLDDIADIVERYNKHHRRTYDSLFTFPVSIFDIRWGFFEDQAKADVLAVKQEVQAQFREFRSSSASSNQ